jgi:RNA polymerase sigma-32 factor
MQEHILYSWSLVKIGTTGAQKKLSYNLRRLRARIEGFERRDILPETVAAIAHELDVSEADVVHMDARLLGADHSLNAHRGDDTEEEWIEQLTDDQPSQETTVGDAEESRQRHLLLDKALMKLGARERQIVVERRMTRHRCGSHLDCRRGRRY